MNASSPSCSTGIEYSFPNCRRILATASSSAPSLLTAASWRYTASGFFKLPFVSSHLRDAALRRCTLLLKEQQLVWSVLLVCSIQTDPLEKAAPACTAYLTSDWGRLAFHSQQPRPGLNGLSASNFWQGRALTRWFAFPLPLELCQCGESSPTSRTTTKTGPKAALCDPHFLYKRSRVISKPNISLCRQKIYGFKATLCSSSTLKLQFVNWACLDWTGAPGLSIHLLSYSLFVSSLSRPTMSPPFGKYVDRWASCLFIVRQECWFRCVRCWRWACSCEK